TGRQLWRRQIRSVGRRGVSYGGGNVVTDGDSVYAATGTVCVRLDARTGEDRQLYRLPTAPPRFTLDEPRDFDVPVDDRHSGKVTVATDDSGLTVTLTTVDDVVTNLHRRDGPQEGETWKQFIDRLVRTGAPEVTPQLGDSWEVFVDLRPAAERGGFYGPGVFQLIVVPPTGEENVTSYMPAAGDTFPAVTVEGELTQDGASATVRMSWEELAKIAGRKPTDLAMGFALNCSDDGDKRTRTVYRFANADSFRLTNGWATFVIDPAGAPALDQAEEGLLPAELAETHVWGYPTVVDDMVIGTAGPVPQRNYVRYWSNVAAPGESRYVFALDKEDGSPLWLYELKHSVSHNMIAVGDGRLYLVDRVSSGEIAAAKRRGETLKEDARLVALDLSTGQVLWETTEAIAGRTHLCWAEETLLADDRRNLVAYNPDGSVRWQRATVTTGRFPVIVGGVVYAEPNAFDLQTGEPMTRRHPLTGEDIPWTFRRAYGCGSISAAPNLLFFRSGAMGMYDLAGDTGVHNFGGVRPGCYINVIAANGLVLSPDADSACTCAYNFQTSLALEPAPEREEDWSIFSVPTSASARIRHARLNLGAPGDRRDDDGNVWLCMPRPIFPSTVHVPMAVETADGGGWFRRNADDVPVSGTDRPWVFASACRDLRRATLQLTYDPPVYCAPCDTAPTVDGALDDACWRDAQPLTLTDDNALVNPRVTALMRRAPDAVVFGLHVATALADGRPVAWDAETTGEDAPVWTDESWLVLITDGPRKKYLRLGVALNSRHDALCNFERRNNVDVKWNGEWRSATAQDADGWTAEMEVPLEVIRSVGLDPDTMRVNVFHFNHTGVGPQQVRLVYPSTWTWRKCYGYKYVVFDRPDEPEPTKYRVTLHFAELENLPPGRRVFDIRLQGETVAENFDVAREAGGVLKAVSRTFDDIEAGGTIEIELLPTGAAQAGPVLNAIEVHEE
ncbi:MAG: PQQ-binding-like beta-propeller repeat protein, partial [Armatimonadetes bacterium]|nr:PQQ-binding-like beta-propeller repeat protein [Armatimonadota bacterium]